MSLTLVTNSDLAITVCPWHLLWLLWQWRPRVHNLPPQQENWLWLQKGDWTSGSPKDVLTLLPRGKSGSCGLSLAQSSTSLLSPKKTKEKIWSCHSPCSHKRHSKSWPWARFCDTKHKLMSRSLHQIRDLSDFLYITHANSGQTQILRGS